MFAARCAVFTAHLFYPIFAVTYNIMAYYECINILLLLFYFIILFVL